MVNIFVPGRQLLLSLLASLGKKVGGFGGEGKFRGGSRNLFGVRVQHAKREKPNWQAMLGQLPKLICQLSKKRAKSCNLKWPSGQCKGRYQCVHSQLHLHRPKKENKREQGLHSGKFSKNFSSKLSKQSQYQTKPKLIQLTRHL